MRKSDLEAWTLSIIDRVNRKQPIEDDRIELKGEWIAAAKAARRIAAHANAARGEPILWLIGVDESRGVVDIKPEDFSTWWPQVQSQFESALAPTPEFLVVPYVNNFIVAILFETDRAPFTIKNPKYGGGGEGVEWEVPWREGTKTRTATRSDLLKILVPLQRNPRIEALGGTLSLEKEADGVDTILHLNAQIFVEQERERVVFFKHRCSGIVESAQGTRLAFGDLMLDVADPSPERGTFSNRFIACFSEPGVFEVEAFALTNDPLILTSDSLQITLQMDAGAQVPVHVQFRMHRPPGAVNAAQPEWGFGTFIRSEADKYKMWVNAVIHALMRGPGNAVQIGPDDHEWATRAISEGRLSWGLTRNTVILPSLNIDRL